jgi:hypothetical protein
VSAVLDRLFQSGRVPPGIHPATGDPVLNDGVIQRMTADFNRAARTVHVRFQHVYGKVTAYPACPVALEFASIARTRTILPTTIASAQRLGFQLVLVDGGPELLAEYMRGQS